MRIIKTLLLGVLSVSAAVNASTQPPSATNQWYWEHISDVKKAEIITLFSHGFGGDHAHGVFYGETGLLFPSRDRKSDFAVFDYPDAPAGLFGNKQSGLAQKSEMERLDKAIENVRKHKKDLVLWGISCGASNTVNVVGKHAAEGKSLDDVKALVLESPFGHSKDAVNQLAQNLGWNGGMSPWIVRWFLPEYCETSNIPAEWAKHIPSDMPILLICTKKDTIVPAESTKKIYQSLKATGHEHVYLFEATQGAHCNIFADKNYLPVLHAFYKKYNLSHDESCADAGQALLAQCQPSA